MYGRGETQMEYDFEENIYADGTDDYSEIHEQTEDEKKPRHGKSRGMLLIFIQLGFCIAAIACAFVLKLIGGNIYAQAATWFFSNYNNSVFTDDVSRLLPFSDEVSVSSENKAFVQQGEESKKETAVKFTAPLKSLEVTSAYGKRQLEGSEQFHKGIDLAAQENESIFAACDGEVTIAQQDDSYGNYVVITHDNNLKTLYAHCSKLIVKKGDKVKAGDKIALAGQTGQAYGVHLHFEVLVSGKNADPCGYLDIAEQKKDEA